MSSRQAFCRCGRPLARLRRLKAFTVIELLVVLAVIAVLMGILLPALISVREQSRSAGCLSNLRQIGHAFFMYANDHRGRLPPADLRDPLFQHPPGNWATIMVSSKYLSVPETATGAVQQSVFRCPSGLDLNGFADVDAYSASRTSSLQAAYWQRHTTVMGPNQTLTAGIAVRTWYGINAEYQDGQDYPMFRVPSETHRTDLHLLTQVRQPSTMAMVYDGFFHHDGQNNLMGHARHLRGTSTNYLFADGHAAGVFTKELPVSFSDADLAARPFPKFKLRQ